MRLVGLAVAGIALIASGPALAQYVPRPVMPIGSLAADDVSDIVQAMGLAPMGQPMRSGPFYVQRTRDDFGRVLIVTVDVRRSQVVAVEAVGPRPYRGGPYAAYRGPYGRLPYPAHGALPDDDFAIAPPGSIIAPRQAGLPPAAVPQQPQTAPRPATKSATITPSRPPVPRKRPVSAPQQASAGSVDPVAPAPQVSPPPDRGAAAPAVPAQAAEPAMSPVAPLE